LLPVSTTRWHVTQLAQIAVMASMDGSAGDVPPS